MAERWELVRLLESLAEHAPLDLAESWDNVGLLAGDLDATVGRVLLCLTISPPVVEEAVAQAADLVVTHHPLPFRPFSRLTTADPSQALLWRLVRQGIAVYSAHTAFDSAVGGINDLLAERLGLSAVAPLIPAETPLQAASDRAAVGSAGSGRWGTLDHAISLGEFARQGAAAVGTVNVGWVGDPEQPVQRCAVACGSGGSFLEAARRQGCDTLVTGEANLHACLEAEATGVGLVLLGHFASERFAMETLAERLARQHPGLDVWASRCERDPVRRQILAVGKRVE